MLPQLGQPLVEITAFSRILKPNFSERLSFENILPTQPTNSSKIKDILNKTSTNKSSFLQYRISSYSFRRNYSFLNLEIQRSQYINLWKLFKGGNYTVSAFVLVRMVVKGYCGPKFKSVTKYTQQLMYVSSYIDIYIAMCQSCYSL